ncbi:MAG: aminotransferase class I/II-fold pyridoxal phosphate-dependent enzyme [Candidatus ainarchaeum sp.]|nr:aminotransferase class I/II-fold pyridoxal phosphate-dependent enzyme [Candidatus ainarchaeum sp.]
MKINDFKLERFFAKYEFTAPYLLCSSDCESFSIKEILDLEKGSEKELKKLWLGYTESQGNPKLKKEIAKLYKTIKPEEIIVFSGAEEGIFIFMNVLLKKGDNIIVQFPGYQSLYEIATSIGCEVTNWPMSDENNWELDIEFLKNNIKENTKAIIINFPHNPTGYLPSKEKLNQIIKLAKQKNIYIFSDEVYRLLEYNKNNTLPAIADCYDKAFSLGVMSKTFGLAGLRIGWIATKDKNLFKKIASFRDFTTICNSAPSEFLSIIALKHKEILIKRNFKIIKNNLNLLDNFFKRYDHLFEWVRPKAGSIAFPKIKFNKNVEDFCIDLVNKKGVLLLPSTVYDLNDKHFRIGFGRKNMAEALGKLEEYIKEHHK